jgi:glycine/sarcosine N-methyltransferase
MDKPFFDSISSFYDDMVGFDAALDRRAGFLQKFVSPGMEYAADIGCGTGLDSISLSRLGLKVRAFDISSGMIEKAEQNAEKYGAKIKFYNAGFDGMPDIFNNSFDLVVSLGNTIANVPSESLNTSISAIYTLLKPGGKAVVQILNYEKLKSNNDRIINITRNETTTFIRFYDFLDKNINFNILRFTTANPKERIMDTVMLYPYSEQELIAYFQKAGFREVETYGSLGMDNYSPAESNDLVLKAIK